MSHAPVVMGTSPWIACRDLDASVKHYREVLGFDDDWHWFWGDPPDHAGVSRGRARIAFYVDPEHAAAREGLEVVVYVRGVAAVHEELIASGADIVRPLGERPWGTIDFSVRDPDGVRLIFTEAPDVWS